MSEAETTEATDPIAEAYAGLTVNGESSDAPEPTETRTPEAIALGVSDGTNHIEYPDVARSMDLAEVEAEAEAEEAETITSLLRDLVAILEDGGSINDAVADRLRARIEGAL